jgi:hypothetical protein
MKVLSIERLGGGWRAEIQQGWVDYFLWGGPRKGVVVSEWSDASVWRWEATGTYYIGDGEWDLKGLVWKLNRKGKVSQ